MKVVSSDALTKLIQLSKDEFLSKNNTTTVTTSGLKTINGTSILGTGDIDTTELPSQTSQSGKFLTTNGTTVSWANIPTEIPSQTSQSGKFLTTNGSTASWANIPTEIPTQAGNSGKFLTTDGTDASWATVDTLPSQTSQSGKFLTTNGSTASWANIPTEIPSQSGNSGKFLTTDGTDTSWADALTPNASITGATKCKITYDSKGLVTAGADLSASDIPSLTLSKISDVTATATEVNVLDGITASTAELNILDGVTASASEINVLDGITATTTELNYVDGVTSAIQTQIDNKVTKTNSTSKVYGTDSSGAQTTYDVNSFGAVDDVKVGTSSVVTNKVATLGTMAGEATSSYYTKTEVDGIISSVYKPAGSVAYASLPTPASTNLGNVYNVTDAFTTDSRFVEGSGNLYPAGTNVVVIDAGSSTYKFDVLSGFVDLSGYVPTSRKVNNKALTADISLSASDVGAQETLVSGTNIKTINNTSLLGSGNVTIDSLPSQSGQSGKYLTTDGTDASWTNISIPTVNNATLTITQGGATKGTFTANASSDVTIALDSSGGSVDIDNKSITTNSSDELQTVGVINQNDSTSAIKTWTGTKAQYDAITTKDSNTLYTITDDVVLASYANTDLSNISSTGKNISTWSINVTNCLTEIPQDIKLELNNGTLTLKAGSKVYVPNGSGVFTVVTLDSDISRSTFGTQDGSNCIVECIYSDGSITGITWSTPSNTDSGTTPPTSGIYYNTDTNYINAYTNGSITDQRSFPIALVTMSSGVVQSIDQVFNGFGYIGSTVFALPGVKGLIPNGRNDDGTLKNIAVSVSSVRTVQVNQYTGSVRLSQSYIQAGTTSIRLEENENFVYDGSTKLSVLIVGLLAQNSGKITSFTPKTVFHATDYNDIGNGTITITQGGTTKGTFTTNQTGDTTISLDLGDTLPSQSGNSGKFLTTNGTSASWATVDTLPSQTSQSGKFLTTNGTSASWATVDVLPSQSGNSGKYLTTDGSAASWASVSIPTVNNPTITIKQGSVTKGSFTLNQSSGDTITLDAAALPSQSGNSGKYLTTDGTDASWGSITIPTVNNNTITITQGGVSKGTFTLNQSSNKTIALDAGINATYDSSTSTLYIE